MDFLFCYTNKNMPLWRNHFANLQHNRRSQISRHLSSSLLTTVNSVKSIGNKLFRSTHKFAAKLLCKINFYQIYYSSAKQCVSLLDNIQKIKGDYAVSFKIKTFKD